MNILDYFFPKQDKETWAEKARQAAMIHQQENNRLITQGTEIKSSFYDQPYEVYETIFDGEKTQGELGAPIKYFPDYNTLSYRSWQAYTESDIAQIIVKAYVNWVIGSGLKLQSEPVDSIINNEGFNFDREEFIKITEARYRLYAETKDSVYSKMTSLNLYQRTAIHNAVVGGDVLIIDRLENGLPTKQIIDGIHVQQPNYEFIQKAEEKGHSVINGVEINDRGTHIAYYVKQKNDYSRILARGSRTGRLQAYLLYGSHHRIDNVRGMPLLSAVLEKMKKLDRYNEAEVAAAEERAKIPWAFEHNINSTGENPDIAQMVNAMGGEVREINTDLTKQQTLIKRTFQKDAINLPPGVALRKLEANSGQAQEAFTTGNFIFICASIPIPYEVALMKYVNSFSSSRMASQSWGMLIKIFRDEFNEHFNKPFYNLFLDSQILSGKIKADGYFTAMNKKDPILLQAYRKCRFIGPGVPQADPSKEVKAEVEKINNNLTTHEEAMERLNSGADFNTTIDKLGKEKQKIIDDIPKEEQNNVTN